MCEADTRARKLYLIHGPEGTGKDVGRALNSVKVGFDDIPVGVELGFEGDEGGHEPIGEGNEGKNDLRWMNENVCDQAEDVRLETGKWGLLHDIRQISRGE